jgi:hypothetical protein
VADLKRANLCRKQCLTTVKAAEEVADTSQSAVTFHRVAAFCFARYGSLNSPPVLVRFDHISDSQKVKEAHLGITGAANR